MATGDKLIQVKDLKKYYNGGDVKALDGVTVDVYLVVKGATYLPIEPLVIVGVIYFIMTFVLSKVFGHFERKMKKADRNNGYGRKRKQQREVHI